ncbi:ORF6N domain-containing protein [Candidatus Jettenia sp. AMX1]
MEVKALNQAVRRNIERFPVEFMFQSEKHDCETTCFAIGNKY